MYFECCNYLNYLILCLIWVYKGKYRDFSDMLRLDCRLILYFILVVAPAQEGKAEGDAPCYGDTFEPILHYIMRRVADELRGKEWRSTRFCCLCLHISFAFICLYCKGRGRLCHKASLIAVHAKFSQLSLLSTALLLSTSQRELIESKPRLSPLWHQPSAMPRRVLSPYPDKLPTLALSEPRDQIPHY